MLYLDIQKETTIYKCVDIMTGEKFRLLKWTLFIGQFVHPVVGKGMG